MKIKVTTPLPKRQHLFTNTTEVCVCEQRKRGGPESPVCEVWTNATQRSTELILPVAVYMCHELMGEAAANKLLTIALSNETLSHRITDMVLDIQHQLPERLKSTTFFSLQLDESIFFLSLLL